MSNLLNPLNPLSPLNPLHPIHDTGTETREPHSNNINSNNIKVDGTILAVTFGLIGALLLAGFIRGWWREA